MHARYLFLIDLDAENLSDADALRAACARFEETFESRLDDNNWYRTMGLLVHDRAYITASDDDPRTGHEILEEQIKAPETFRRTVAASWLYNTADFVLQNKHIDWTDLPIDRNKAARDEFIARVTAYAGALKKNPCLNRRLASFVTSARNCRIAGFTKSKRATPYDWRCFDLRSTARATGNAILFMDIHT